MLQASEARTLWKSFDKGLPYTWRIAGKCKEELGNIIGPSNLTLLYQDEDPLEFNKRLRPLVGRFLTKESTSRPTARWIVGSWGGIRKGLETVDTWADVLVRSESTDSFEFMKAPIRISSWSKLLAFRDHTKYAIYDARTASTLNLGLEALDKVDRFYVPMSQNKAVQGARRRAAPPNPNWGYDEYLSILGDFVTCGVAPDILVAEMTLFANSLAVIEGA